jgi:hypothetical protein
MTLILRARDYLSICDGTKKRLDGAATDPLVAAWIKKDIAAAGLLVQTIDHDILKALVTCTTAAEIWSGINIMQDRKAMQSIDKL